MPKKLIYKGGNESSKGQLGEKQVVSYYSKPTVITDNLGSEFKTAKTAGSSGYSPPMRTGFNKTIIPPHLEKKMKRRGSGASANTVFQGFHSPFRIRPNIEQPTKKKDRNEWYRFYFKYDPIVHTAIMTHSTFPLSRFRVEHDDPAFMEFLNEMCDDIDLHSFMIKMATEYFVVGEAFPFGFLDDPDDPTRWQQFILMDPDKVYLNAHPFAYGGGQPYSIEMEPDKDLIKIVDNGPSDEKTGILYQNIPPDIISYVKKKENIPVPILQISHFKREVNPFQARGESILSCVLADLMYLDKLREGQWHIVDRHITPKEIWKVGEPDDPADNAELESFRELIAMQYHSPNQAYVMHHAVQFQMEGAGGRVLPLQPEFEFVNKRLYAGLGINESMITSSGPSFASSSVAMDIMIGRYEQFRTQMEQWLIHKVFKPMCKIHNIYKTTSDKNSKFNRYKNMKVPDLPRIVWEKVQLRDEMMKVQLFEKLAATGVIPRSELYKLLNLSAEQMRKGFLEQAKQDMEDMNKFQKLQAELGTSGAPGGLPAMGGPAGAMGGGMPMGGGAGAGMGMPGGMPPGGGMRQPGPGGGGGMGGGGASTPSPLDGGGAQRPPDSNRATQM